MKKLNIFIALILSFTLIVVGCSNSAQEEEQEISNVENNIEEIKEEDTPEEGKEEKDEDTESGLTNIFSKAEDMDAYYYEIYTDLADGTSYVTKIWYSENKTRMESDFPETEENIIMIMDGEEKVNYIYMPAENMAIKTKYEDSSEFTEEEEEEGTQDYIDIMKELADDEEVTVENDTFEGESVKIVTREMGENTNKIWISNETGFPLKSEFYMDGNLESTSILKNFEEKSIDPSNFTLPEGVEIQDMTNY